jgi:hypothetical protein
VFKVLGDIPRTAMSSVPFLLCLQNEGDVGPFARKGGALEPSGVSLSLTLF